MTTDTITSAALALSPESRAILADVLLRSLDPKETIENHAAWVREAEERLSAYERREIKSFSRAEVMGSLRGE